MLLQFVHLWDQTVVAGAPLMDWLKALGIWVVLSGLFIGLRWILANRLVAFAQPPGPSWMTS
jgi:uncharacterized YccA/Bax inhibitor family protein